MSTTSNPIRTHRPQGFVCVYHKLLQSFRRIFTPKRSGKLYLFKNSLSCRTLAQLYTSPRNIALTDYLTRAIRDYVYSNRLDMREGDGDWSGQKGDDFRIDKPEQQVLQRTSVMVKKEWVEVRCTIGLPAQGKHEGFIC